MDGASRGRSRSAAIAGIWPLSIFITSCYYINGPAFVRFMQRLVPGEWFGPWFERFWLNFGLFVVKGWHVTEYAILLVVCFRLLQRWKGWSDATTLRWSILLCVLFAASDEWHQTFVPQRDGCFRDVGIDTAGILLAAGCILLRAGRAPSTRSREKQCSPYAQSGPLAGSTHG